MPRCVGFSQFRRASKLLELKENTNEIFSSHRRAPGAASIEDAERLLDGEGNLRLARKARWLVPKIQENRLTLFDYDECLVCWKRICAEGYNALRAAAAAAEQEQKNAAY
jgi:hypothetical protein